MGHLVPATSDDAVYISDTGSMAATSNLSPKGIAKPNTPSRFGYASKTLWTSENASDRRPRCPPPEQTDRTGYCGDK